MAHSTCKCCDEVSTFHASCVSQTDRHLALLQEMYCFVLPFVLKWVVAALVVSVLVDLFSTLRKQGDHSHSSVPAQIHALLTEWWQCLFHRAPSNQDMLATVFRLNGRGRTFRALATSVRFTPHVLACSLSNKRAGMRLYITSA